MSAGYDCTIPLSDTKSLCGSAVRLAHDEIGYVEGFLVCIVLSDLVNMSSSKQVINRLCVTPFFTNPHCFRKLLFSEIRVGLLAYEIIFA